MAVSMGAGRHRFLFEQLSLNPRAWESKLQSYKSYAGRARPATLSSLLGHLHRICIGFVDANPMQIGFANLMKGGTWDAWDLRA